MELEKTNNKQKNKIVFLHLTQLTSSYPCVSLTPSSRTRNNAYTLQEDVFGKRRSLCTPQMNWTDMGGVAGKN